MFSFFSKILREIRLNNLAYIFNIILENPPVCSFVLHEDELE